MACVNSYLSKRKLKVKVETVSLCKLFLKEYRINHVQGAARYIAGANFIRNSLKLYYVQIQDLGMKHKLLLIVDDTISFIKKGQTR